jgi:GntR family transcriptional regulator
MDSPMNLPQHLNRQSPLALYYQLKHILLAQIDGGVYKDGDRLPSEYDLTRQYKVSRHVVRQALKDLIAEGRIVAQQGMGYFVNNRRFRKALPKLSSHTNSMASLGHPTQTLVITQKVTSPPDFVAESLLSPGEQQAIFIERVSFLDDEPVCMIRAYYPLKYSSVLLDVDLNNKSIYSIFQNCYSIIPKRAETIVSVVFADEAQSPLLNIREGMPLLHLGSFTWSENGELFEYSSGYYRIDRFELELEQT